MCSLKSILLYVHSQNDVFPFSLLSPLYQGKDPLPLFCFCLSSQFLNCSSNDVTPQHLSWAAITKKAKLYCSRTSPAINLLLLCSYTLFVYCKNAKRLSFKCWSFEYDFLWENDCLLFRYKLNFVFLFLWPATGLFFVLSFQWRLLFEDSLRPTFVVIFINYFWLQNLIFLNFGKKFP